VLLLDKPTGMTSNGALQQAKRLYRAEKAGHTGTLDPLASGLLPLCFGEATKFAQRLLDAPKGDLATLRFGVTTTTGDAEGEVRESRPVDVTRDALEATLARFVGPLSQIPPMYSALKFEGRPLYRYARAGEEVPRAPRAIVVHALRLVSFEPPDAVVTIHCSKGTYVRVLTEDIGYALHCGAHLAALRRSATGGFALHDALTFEQLDAMADAQRLAALAPVESLVAELPRMDVGPDAGRRFGQGQSLPALGQPDGDHAVFADHVFVGVAQVESGVAKPRRVVARHLAENVVFGL